MNKTKNDLIYTLRSFFKKAYNYSLSGSVDELYKLSSKLGVAGVIGYTLNESNIKDSRFESIIYKTLNKHERFVNTRNEIDALFSNNFKYLYIKGLAISKYYEEPYLRYSSDIDIIVEESKYEIAYKLLLENGYKLVRRDKQEITLVNANNIMIDLHRYYTLTDDNFELLFKDCFNDTHELDINYNYVFNLMHCLKHFRSGILNYKFFVDLYYLRGNIDRTITNNLLNSINMKKFDDSMNSYLDCILGNKNYDDNDKDIEDFIFNYIKDSGNNNRVLINSYGKSKLKYLLSRVFIPFDLISEEYPILHKYKILLPIYYVKRVIRIATGKRSKYAYNELKNNKQSSKEQISKMHEFVSKIGAF